MSEVASTPTSVGDGTAHPPGNGTAETVPQKTESSEHLTSPEMSVTKADVNNGNPGDVQSESRPEDTAAEISPENGDNKGAGDPGATANNTADEKPAETDAAPAVTEPAPVKETPMDIEEQLVQMEAGTMQADENAPSDVASAPAEGVKPAAADGDEDGMNAAGEEQNHQESKEEIPADDIPGKADTKDDAGKEDDKQDDVAEKDDEPAEDGTKDDEPAEDGTKDDAPEGDGTDTAQKADTKDDDATEKGDTPEKEGTEPSTEEAATPAEAGSGDKSADAAEKDAEGEEDTAAKEAEEETPAKKSDVVADAGKKAAEKMETEEAEGEEEDEEEHVPLLERPTEVSGRRQRRAVERFTDVSPEVKRTKVEAEGSGTPLADCPCVAHQIQNTSVDELHTLHQLLFARPGRSHEIRKNLKMFNGFAFSADSKEFEQKRVKIQNRYSIVQLRSLSRLLDLEVKASSSREGFAEAITAFLCDPKPSGREVKDMKKPGVSTRKAGKRTSAAAEESEDEEEEEEEEEESEEEEEESEDEAPAKKRSSRSRKGAAKRRSPAKRTPAKAASSRKTTAKRTPAKSEAATSTPAKKTARKPPTERGSVPLRTPKRKRKRGEEAEEKSEEEVDQPTKKSKAEEATSSD